MSRSKLRQKRRRVLVRRPLDELDFSRLESAISAAERDRRPTLAVSTELARELMDYLSRLTDLAIEAGHGSDYRRRLMIHNAGGLLNEIHEHVGNERLWSLQ